MVLVCAVKNCVNSKRKTKQSDCQLHRFPKDISRCNQWLKNCKLYDLCGQSEDYIYKNYRACSKHFVATSYCNPEKTRLLLTATPTEFDNTEEKIDQPLVDSVEVSNEDDIFLDEPRYSSTPSKFNISDNSTHKPPVVITSISQKVYETIIIDDDIPAGIPIDPLTSCTEYDEYVNRNLFNAPTTTRIVKNSVNLQTPNSLSARSPRKLKLKKQLAEEINVKKQLQKTVNELKKQLDRSNTENNCLNLCEMYLPSTMYLLVKNHLTNKNKTPNGQRHLDEIIEFSHTVHYLGPKAYSFLQKHFTLPHRHTLRKKNVQNIDKNIQNTVQNDHKYSKI